MPFHCSTEAFYTRYNEAVYTLQLHPLHSHDLYHDPEFISVWLDHFQSVLWIWNFNQSFWIYRTQTWGFFLNITFAMSNIIASDEFQVAQSGSLMMISFAQEFITLIETWTWLFYVCQRPFGVAL